MKMSINMKMAGGFGITIGVLLLISIYNYMTIGKLRVMQDEGAGRARDAVVAEEINEADAEFDALGNRSALLSLILSIVGSLVEIVFAYSITGQFTSQ